MSELYVIEFSSLQHFWGYFIGLSYHSILIFLSTESSSSWVNGPSLMSHCLFIILVIGSCVTYGGFPRKFSKCCFHRCIRSYWLRAFSLPLAVLFLRLSFACYPRLSIFNRVSNLIDLILYVFSLFFQVYVCMLANSFCAFLTFRALVLFGFFLLPLEAVFTSARFSLTDNISHGVLYFVLCLVGMNSVAASRWALTKFSYSSFGVYVLSVLVEHRICFLVQMYIYI